MLLAGAEQPSAPATGVGATATVYGCAAESVQTWSLRNVSSPNGNGVPLHTDDGIPEKAPSHLKFLTFYDEGWGGHATPYGPLL